jgi:hypothetical protein
MSSLLVFNRVYRLEIQSVIWVFSTGFVNYCPSNLLSGYLSRLPPLPFVNKYTIYTYTGCKVGGVWGHRRGGALRQIEPLPLSPYTGQFF